MLGSHLRKFSTASTLYQVRNFVRTPVNRLQTEGLVDVTANKDGFWFRTVGEESRLGCLKADGPAQDDECTVALPIK